VRGFLYGQLVPHAEAEEGVLYPLLDKVMGAAGATATMVADHREIHRHIDAFAKIADGIAQGPPQPGQLEALREHLYALWAIVHLHLDKEEQILYELLDERLSPADTASLYDRLAEFGQHLGRHEPPPSTD
jgi:iron-sulfur cluster repair protein YtfE (RIC family)